MTHPVIELAQALIQRESVTPEDAGCQALMNERLEKLGFNIESLFFTDTLNTWARKGKNHHTFVLLVTQMLYQQALQKIGSTRLFLHW